jgi:hypothetical protein
VWTQENRDTELHVLSIFLFYPEEDRSCLPNLISGVGRYTARSTRAVTSAKARSGGIVFFTTYMYAISHRHSVYILL